MTYSKPNQNLLSQPTVPTTPLCGQKNDPLGSKMHWRERFCRKLEVSEAFSNHALMQAENDGKGCKELEQ